MRTNLRKTYNILIRATIIVLTFGFLYDQLFYRSDMQSVIDFFPAVSGGGSFWWSLLLVVLLMPLNLMLEVWKWRLLIAKLEQVSIWNAIKAVLTGISVSMFLPNRVGDYLGRVFILKKANHLQAVLATVLGSLAQLLTTVLFGLAASLVFFPSYFDMDISLNRWMYSGWLVMVCVLVVTLVFSFLNFAALSAIIKRVTGRQFSRVKKYSQVFSWYSSRDLFKVLGLSVARYLVFSFQFYWLIHDFEVVISYPQAMMLISLVYLMMAIIPTVALTEIGVRGSVSLFVFQLYMEPHGSWSELVGLGVASASTLLWLVNLAFPALLGTLFVYSLRFFRKKNGNSN